MIKITKFKKYLNIINQYWNWLINDNNNSIRFYWNICERNYEFKEIDFFNRKFIFFKRNIKFIFS